MNSKWIGFFAWVYLAGVFLGGSFEKHTGVDWMGNTVISEFSYLLNFTNIFTTSSTIGGIGIPSPNQEYFNTFYKVMLLHFEFLQGPGYSIVYEFLVFPLACVGILSVLIMTYNVIAGILPWGSNS